MTGIRIRAARLGERQLLPQIERSAGHLFCQVEDLAWLADADDLPPAFKSGSKRLAAQLDAILGRLIIYPFDAPADEHYGQLRHDLQKKGQVIGANDMLIAAHALALRRTLVTDNLGVFKRVRGLSTKNWLR